MRFIHIADVHLGANPDAGNAYSPKRSKEIWGSFAGIVERCRKEQVEVLLIAGDLFHRQPLLRELREVDYLFSQIPDTHIFIIAGNHDYLKKDSYYRTFVWSENVCFIKSGDISCVEVPELELAVYGLSYHQREITDNRYDCALPKGRQKYEILLAHGGDEKHIPFKRNKISSLNYNYIAMGHIHKHSDVIPGTAAYSGAPEPIDINDTGKHGYIKGEITGKGTHYSFVPCAAREYVALELKVDQRTTGFALREAICTEMEERGKHHMYKLTVSGFRNPDAEFDLEHMDIYGNMVEIRDITKPAYDFDKLRRKNKDNLLGKFIESLEDSDKGSLEYYALCEGVQALVETRRGRV